MVYTHIGLNVCVGVGGRPGRGVYLRINCDCLVLAELSSVSSPWAVCVRVWMHA